MGTTSTRYWLADIYWMSETLHRDGLNWLCSICEVSQIIVSDHMYEANYSLTVSFTQWLEVRLRLTYAEFL